MATQVQFRRGNTAQTSTFTGATAELTVDTDKEVVVVHDGVTAGGYPLARESALTANQVFSQASFNTANGAFTTANSAGSYANSAFLVANSAATYSNTVNNTQNTSIAAAFTTANSAGVYANGAFTTANSAGVYANGAFNAANTADSKATSAGSYANSAFIHANASFSFANTISGGAAIDNVARSLANTAEQTAITAGSYANSAFIRANNSLNANTGGTVVGDVSITGNLTVTGNVTYTNTTTLLVADNIITVNAAINQSAQPTVNAGIEVDRGAQPNTSILWIETSGKWSANDGNTQIFLASEATLTSAFDTANAAFLAANAATATDTTQNNSITAAFTQANSNFISAVTRLTVTNSGASAYLIDQYSGNNPSVYVSGGETLAFHLNNVTGHPFMIRVSNGGANYDTGLTHVSNTGTVLTGSSAQGQVTGTLYWKVPFDIVGSTYVYQCSAHAGMVGNIVIQQPASFVAANTAFAFTAANTPSHVANSAAIYANGAFAQANTDVTNITISPSQTYGNATHYSIITVSANGRINAISTQVVTDPSAIAFAIALG